jgi:hypothetical protein
MRITPTPTRAVGVAVAAAVATVAAVAAVHGSARAATSGAAGRVGFARHITNPYLPYRPGSTWVYAGVKDGVTQTDVVHVTDRTRMIDGVRCTSITDVATHGARVLERTIDWYAQDRRGNVWYFGEATKAYGPAGQVDTSGSWLAGVHGARPGIVMTAHPAVGDAHRQEYWAGHAEDQYWLVDLGSRVSVPFGTFARAARTLEWSRLEPGVIDEKMYVRGVGVVQERAAEGPPEVARLVRFTHR